MKKIIALAAVALLAIAASCDTENVGGPPVFFSVEITSVTPADPAGLFGGENATFNAAITGGVAPYTYSWNFGSASTPSPSVSPAGATTSITQTLTPSATQQTYTVTVTATDGNNVVATDTQVITVGPTRNAPPVVNSATYSAATGVLTVTVSDPDDGETLDVTVTPPAGFAVDDATKTAAATGPLTATFNVSATDIVAGATGNFGVSVTDGDATADFAGGVSVTIDPITVPDNTLVAIPLVSSAAVGDPVTVLVLTGELPNPFQYMTGVGLTIENDASYVATSFDAGTPDATPDVGAVNPMDGVWGVMNPPSFLLGGDSFIVSSDAGGGRERWDFNLTPLNGSDLTGADTAGVLFNVKFTFAAAGTKTFGFIEQTTGGVKRTYYAGSGPDFFWGDITNDGSVGPNSVTIN